MSRQFVEMIFLGNGDHSVAQRYRLHKRLEEALDILGGIQQRGEVPRGAEYELTHCINDIVTALTLKEVSK
jgi:hypothetical protein